jgi:hypothetical protein
MKPFPLAKSIRRQGISVRAVFVAIATLGACVPGGLLLGAGEFDASPAAPEVRVIAGAASAAIEQELRSADRALLQAIAASDRVASARLLDPEFAWIDRDGRGRNKSELVSRMILLAAGPDANVSLKRFGRVALITGTHRLTPDNVPAFFARLWVRQPSGWRLLLYHETAPPDAVVKDTRFATPAQLPARCDNPCRSLPYKPLTPEAQEIVASFMAVEKAVFDGDAQTANRILGDDVVFVRSAGAEPMGKSQRLATLRASRQAGPMLPSAVDSMALWVYGNAAVMSADQESPAGEMLRTTRIWAKRDAQWQLTFSQQTLVQ